MSDLSRLMQLVQIAKVLDDVKGSPKAQEPLDKILVQISKQLDKEEEGK